MIREGKMGRPVGTFKGDALRKVNFTVRVTEDQKELLDRKSKELDVPLSDIFHGFIEQMSEKKSIKDPIKLTVDHTPMVISRSEAKNLLLDLTKKLLNT